MAPGELRERLLAVITAGVTLDDAEFDALARDVFAYQYACNAPYRRFCERRDAAPQTVAHWTEIPAVPVDAFKAIPLVCGNPADARVTFRTSGTTLGSGRRGEHHLPELALYDAALASGFATHLLPDGAGPRIVSLIPPPEAAPDSSLSHMAGEVMRRFAAPGSGGFAGPDGIDHAGLEAALHDAERDGEAVCLLGTSFAYVHWMDLLREQGKRFRLPASSRVMDTGGFKGRSREVSPRELRDGFAELLGVGTAWCVNEYGMTEMSSQFYDGVAGRAATEGARTHRGPLWVRSRTVDPETLHLLPQGQPGALRHWDLANLYSVMAIQTADLGVCSDGGFHLRGRARGAEARGCSLAMEELLAALNEKGA